MSTKTTKNTEAEVFEVKAFLEANTETEESANAQATLGEYIAKAESERAQAVEKYFEALKGDNLAEMTLSLEAISKAEANIKTFTERKYFEIARTYDNPILYLCVQRTYSYVHYKPKKSKATGMIVDFDHDNVEVRINLESAVEYLGLGRNWIYTVGKFNQLLCIKAGQELGFSNDNLESLAKSLYAQSIVTALDEGKTPTSNTKSLEMLQLVINEMIGKTPIKASSKDVAYITHLLVSKGKTVLAVKMTNCSQMVELIADIIYRAARDKKYFAQLK